MSSALAAVLLPLAAHAADAPGTPDATIASEGKPAEVKIVGSRGNDFKADYASSAKYTEKLVDTAQSIQVIKKELIEQQGALTLTEALRNSPGVGTFSLGENGATNTGDAVYMRGFDASNSIFVDGVRDVGSISRDIFNIEQVEVVKGPAGTDNGRGSPTGSINLVSKKAHLGEALSASATVGTASQKRVTADYNTTLDATRGIALRLNVMALDADDPARNEVHNRRWAIAPTVAFGLKGTTRLYLDYLHVDQDNLPDSGVSTVGLPGYSSPDPKRPYISGAAPVDPRNFYGSTRDYDKVKADMFTARIEHELAPNMKLLNVTRYGKTDQDYLLTSFTATAANLLTPNPADPSTWTVARSNRTVKDQENTILTNQATITSQFATGALQHTLVTGLELTSESQRTYGYSGLGTLPAANLYHPNPHDPVTGLSLTRNGVFNDSTIDTQALYAFDTVKVGDWILVGGARLDHYRGNYSMAARSTATSNPNLPVGTLVSSQFSLGDTIVNGKLSALYKPTADSSVYAMVASSKQPPGSNFTVTSAANNASNPIYQPQETVTSEVGGKLDLFNQKLALTGALFRTEIKNEVEQDPVDLLFYQTGKKRVQGIELGVSGELAHDWLVSAGYLRMNTKVESGKVVTAAGVNNLAYTPKQSFTLWTSYTLPFGLKIGGGARFNDKLLRGTDGAIGTPAYVDSYWVFDAMAQYQLSKMVDLRLNVYNLTDRAYAANINKSGYRYTPGAPRSGSLTLNFHF
jgi:catecholate siderophore receptor